MLIHSEVGKKGGDFLLAHFKRVALVVKKDKAFDPLEVGRFGANTVVPYPKRVANLIE
jgi:L-lysine 2,3-aminomutase